MYATRRHFVHSLVLGGAGLTIGPIIRFDRAVASEAPFVPRDATGELMAVSTASFYRPYRSRSAPTSQVTTWVQIDLGSSQVIEAVKLYPAIVGGFPLRFRIQYSDDPAFETAELIADRSRSDYPDPLGNIVQFGTRKAKGRYVRVTATALGAEQIPPEWKPIERTPAHVFALAKIDVISKGADIAVHRPVTVDAILGNPADAQQLTRAPRPQGEGVVTDNPQNVTFPDQWRPVAYRAQSPTDGIQIQDGLFFTALVNNIGYLLTSSVDDLLRPFRQRAHKSVPPPTRILHPIWDIALPGSSAGRFLMGAANTLHWIDHSRLRERVTALVEGISDCREPDGYIMAYPKEAFFESEHGAYERSWVTQGLIEAGNIGNPTAFGLLRGYYDWYNTMPYLPQALRRCGFGPQGTVANTRMYFTPVGKPQDLQVVQRYLQENYWLEALAARKTDAIWQYPYDRPHGYLITFLEPYLDLYRATGERFYLKAVMGGWELFRDHWQNIGGSISMIEHVHCPPDANSLQEHLGETCCSAFWILLNQRLHLLDPEEEKYIAEIEKSIYNVLLANQDGSQGIRYHAMLVGHKDKSTHKATCCEGQGTRLLASLPQFIYSVAEDGLYVNLFEPSSIAWNQSGIQLRCEMATQFPHSPNVRLNLDVSSPVQAKLRIRVPSWAAGVMDIAVNGARVGAGSPGSYVTLDRRWSAGDRIDFVLPIGFRLTKYAGVDQIQGKERYALEYGPILMAALGAADAKLSLRRAASPQALLERLRPLKERPLHFILSDPLAELVSESETEFAPYFEIGTESFSCFPVVEAMPSFL